SLQSLGVKGLYFENLPMAGVLATPGQINALANMNGVRSIWHNYQLEYENDGANAITGVDDVRTDAQFQSMNGGVPFSGRGIGVLVNDSGVDATHDDLKDNVVQNVAGQTNLHGLSSLLPYTPIEGVPNTDIGGGHGTHVAGIVAATGAKSGGLYEGVAPAADLIGYGAGAAVALLDVLGAFDYALTHQFEYNIRVITNSWGNTGDAGTDFNPDDPTNIATKKVTDRGIIVVFSAGNSGPGEDTISGNFKKAPWVITVAAGSKSGVLTDFSSRGKAGHGGTVTVDGQTFNWEDRPTITAPGEHIISTRATGGVINGAAFDPDGELLIPPQYLPFYTSLNGTSMACPHVAGIVALMLEANPQLDVYDIKSILEATATEMVGREPFEIGSGYVNAYASVAAALSLDPEPYLFDPFDPNGGGNNGGGNDNPPGVVLTDEEGDETMAGADIVQATVGNETDTSFDVTLHVNDLDQATPSTMLVAGLQVGAMQEYSVEFDLNKPDAATVRYSLSAKRTLVTIDVGTVGLSQPSFDFGVRAADGSGRGIGDVTGTWDDEAGTLTWTVPKAELNVATPPADLTADIDRTGRAAAEGDGLKSFSAAVATSFWGGAVGLTPGQTTYDDASGTSTHTLGDEGAPDPDPDPDPEPDPDPTPAPDADAKPRVVVSVIDSGINPYHEFFHADSEIYEGTAPSSVTQEVLDAFGIDEDHVLHLTRTGDFNADFASDASLWAGVNPGELYWFAGTNIFAISYDPGSRIIMPDNEDDTHGVGTTSAVLRANPEALIVFVEGITDASEAFAFTHPEIDVITTSYGPIGSIPLPSHINKSYTGVVTNGKMHFGAADNSPSTAIQDGTAGPWWSIGIAGFEEEDSEGKQLLSGTLPDFVGDFTQTLPYCANCEDGQQSVGGTSFATPRSAGTASKIVLETRRALGHLGSIDTDAATPVMAAGNGTSLTNWDVRRAMEEAAYFPTVEEYDPEAAIFDLLGLPVPPFAPQVLVGWGAITPETEHEVVSQALAHLGVDGTVTRTKASDVCTFMTTVYQARHAYWDNIAIESETFQNGSEDPYVYCADSPFARTTTSEFSAATLDAAVPTEVSLGSNYPNPFNPSTQIQFTLPADGPVRLAVYNLLGQRVRVLVDSANLSAGTHQVTFEASDLASGTYLYRLETPRQTISRRMVLMK
ncbi:MAG TPA: S8 family peptidase, partial [Rhodothermales bacterium]|nr:S8 family peptidase [Rhodothermales bacterium]